MRLLPLFMLGACAAPGFDDVRDLLRDEQAAYPAEALLPEMAGGPTDAGLLYHRRPTCDALRLRTVRNQHPRAGADLRLWCPELIAGRYPATLWVSDIGLAWPLEPLGLPGCWLYATPVIEIGAAGHWTLRMPGAGNYLVAQALAVTEDGLRVSNAVALRVGRKVSGRR